jgi:glycosyltransferase involved in cell wall biosynthesis
MQYSIKKEMNELSIVVPCYNERFTIEFILLKVICAPIQLSKKEIIIVDDCSKDGSLEILEGLARDWRKGFEDILDRWVKKHPLNVNYRELFKENIDKCSFILAAHKKNKGKGAALRTGIKHTTGDIILIQDADLEYDPFEYPKLLEPLLEGKAEVVFGSRYLGESRRVLSFRHTLINKSLTVASNLFSDLNLTDMETCYKVFKSSILKTLLLKSNRFGFEPEVTAKLSHLGCAIFEVPISYSGRTYEEGKKIGAKDAVKALWSIVKYNMFPGQIVDEPNTEDTYRMAESISYNKEIFNNIKDHCGQKVLEIGGHIGSFTYLLKNKHEVTTVDSDDTSIAILSNRFQNALNVEVVKWDVTKDIPDTIRHEQFNTIAAINILDHIKDDSALLKKFYLILPAGGNVVLMTTNHRSLYSKLDRMLEHHRRYNKQELAQKLKDAGFEIEKLYTYNLVGYFGWLLFAKIFKRTALPQQTRFFDLFAKFYLPLERRLFTPPVGLSLIAVARKNK